MLPTLRIVATVLFFPLGIKGLFFVLTLSSNNLPFTFLATSPGQRYSLSSSDLLILSIQFFNLCHQGAPCLLQARGVAQESEKIHLWSLHYLGTKVSSLLSSLPLINVPWSNLFLSSLCSPEVHR